MARAQPQVTAGRYAPPQEPAEETVAVQSDDGEEDIKLRKVLFAIADLIRTPSDQAQLKAIRAIESVAQKGKIALPYISIVSRTFLAEWNVSRIIAHGFVPNIVDVIRSKFVDVQETACRVIAAMLKNGTFFLPYFTF